MGSYRTGESGGTGGSGGSHGYGSTDESSSSSFTDESGNSGKLGEPEDPESGDWQPNKKKCPCMKKHAQGTRQMHKCIRKCWKEAQEKYRKWKEGKTFFYHLLTSQSDAHRIASHR